VKYPMRALTSSFRRSRQHVAALLSAIAAVVALAAPACNSSSDVAAKLYKDCSQNSDCNNSLICALGQCRPICKTIADCTGGGSCIFDSSGHAVCQSPSENNTSCDIVTAPCAAPLACASDFRCRNLCAQDVDCNVLGITGRVCATDAKGTNYCADPQVPGELDGGVIVQPPPPGTHDGGGTGPNDATTNPGDASMTGRDGTMDAPAMVTVDSGVDGGTTCSPVCGVGFQCVNGGCVACGQAQGAPCCGTQCGANLTCTAAGICSCGDPGQACCGGATCNSSVSCVTGPSGPSCACGNAHQACCPVSDGGGQTQCTAPVQCAGINCSCLVGCSGSTVQASDGSLWTSATVPVTTANGSKFIATNFAYSGSVTCAVQSGGSVSCWGSNSYGQLGNGTTTNSTLPVQVLTGAAGPALSNIVKVFVDSYYGNSACAVDNTGAAWCWGYGAQGQLGTGFTTNSPIAVPVVTQSGGPQLTGVDQIGISNDHACARMTDGSAFCWGSNQYGQIGVGTTQMQYLYPTQVQALFNNVTSISVGINDTCATTNDGSVWCWGSNSYGILGNGLTSGQAIVPAQVAVGDAGTPFGGVKRVELMYYGYSACALKTMDNSVWCWGYYAPGMSNFPVPYTEMSVPISGLFVLCGNQQSGGTVSFIDARGAFHTSGSASTSQVACP
jgi:hypothetical protein